MVEVLVDWQNLDNEILDLWDIYFTDKYHRLDAGPEDRRRCFRYSQGEHIYLFPYILSPIRGTQYYDFRTVYGYGGPVSTSSAPSFLNEASKQFISHFEPNVVAGLVRFHPVLKNHELVSSDCITTSTTKQTVAISLEGSGEDILSRMHQKHRNSVRAAQKTGLIVEIDNELANLESFKERYFRMLDAIKAAKFYYFSSEYFLRLKETFVGQAFILTLRDPVENKVQASALMLQSEKLGHYHLAVVEEDCKIPGVGNLLVYESAVYLQKTGRSWFHMGGGRTNSEQDSLFLFKKRFSSSWFPFYVGEILLNTKAYNELVQTWSERVSIETQDKYKNYLLKYKYAE